MPWTRLHPDMIEGFNHAIRGFSASSLEKMYDVKAWLSPMMDDLHNHTQPHIFLFTRGEDGICYMKSKHWDHSIWLPQDSPGHVLLKVQLL